METDLDKPIFTARHDPLAIRAELQDLDGPFVTVVGLDAAFLAQIPHLDA